MFTYTIDALLVLVSVGMLLRGHYGVTRQAAFIPLVVAVVDAAFAGQLDLLLTPVLSAMLVVLQLVILSASGLLLYQDAVRARNKRARRQRRRELAVSRAAFEQAAAQNDRVCRPACA
ncbi:MAG: hypothetical protein IKU51_01565 [Clostridia bacterium]|nr:hypothetical protein [Clostridia bacterium]